MSSDSDPGRPVRCLLVANRGEIARRILRTAHAMGIATVAVHAPDDRSAPFVAEADVAWALESGADHSPYLDPDALIEAARCCNADAVHPGYGFLSENAGFARAVIDAGLTWVGPPPEVIATMGDKLAAKEAAKASAMPVLASCRLDGDDVSGWLADLRTAGIGWPALIKAVAGGGGRGMRIVTAEAELAEAVASARREAGAAFADDTVFVEPYLIDARHVEVQILADSHGNVVHLGERDCSVQRRHQKIIEEAPSPSIDDTQRDAMLAASVELARSIGYVGAGTVELLVGTSGGELGFHFCEMNTRLQVEHPVTEAVWGIDLVRSQLEIAGGAPLGFAQHDLAATGHAIEARIVAEDPANGWLPSPGVVRRWAPPVGADLRWDSAVESGSIVSSAYDPLVAKAIVVAPTRHEACRRLARALRDLDVHGIRTDRELLIGVLEHPEFVAGRATTRFLDETDPGELVAAGAPSRTARLEHAIAATLWMVDDHRRSDLRWGFVPARFSPVPRPDAQRHWRSGPDEITVTYRAHTDGSYAVHATDDEIVIDTTACFEPTTTADTSLMTLADRRSFAVQIRRDTSSLWVRSAAGQSELEAVALLGEPGTLVGAGTDPEAPVPGRISAVHVRAGDRVEAGATLVTLEAMKVEHRIVAPYDSLVAEVLVVPTQTVDTHQRLVRLEEIT